MSHKDLQTDKEKQLQEEIQDLQTEVRDLRKLLEEKTEELNQAARNRKVRTAAYIDLMNEFNASQAALEELRKDHEALKKAQESTRRKEERFRSETEKLKKELRDREEALKKERSEKETAFQTRIKGVSEVWEVRAEDWANKETVLKEMLQNKVKEVGEYLIYVYDQCQKNITSD